MTTSNPSIVELVHASQDALVARDIDSYLALLADDVVLDDPAAPPLRGHEGARELLSSLLAGLPELAFVERKVWARGDRATMYFRLRFTSVTGKQGELEGIDLFEFNSAGKIQRLTSFYDAAAMAAAFG